MKISLRHVNNGLSVIVLLLALYIIFMPFLPSLVFEVKRATVTAAPVSTASIVAEPVPQENILTIPSLGLREQIHDSSDASALDLGVWRRPHTSTPASGSNTVLVGHRFTYTSPQGVFYHLDKVNLGQELTVFWLQKKYTYVVKRIFIVPPTAVEVEAPANTPLLTLYTCTPLWSGHERLVIQAELKEESRS